VRPEGLCKLLKNHSSHSALTTTLQCHRGGHPASSPEVKRSLCQADHSPPSSAEVKKTRTMPPHPHASSFFLLGYYIIINDLRLYYSLLSLCGQNFLLSTLPCLKTPSVYVPPLKSETIHNQKQNYTSIF
jgi:hypothetical protein